MSTFPDRGHAKLLVQPGYTPRVSRSASQDAPQTRKDHKLKASYAPRRPAGRLGKAQPVPRDQERAHEPLRRYCHVRRGKNSSFAA